MPSDAGDAGTAPARVTDSMCTAESAVLQNVEPPGQLQSGDEAGNLKGSIWEPS